MVSQTIHVLVLDSTFMATELLAASLRQEAGLSVVAATNAPDFITKVAKMGNAGRPVAVVSTTIGGVRSKGLDLCRSLHDAGRPAAVVLLLESLEEPAVLDAFRSGARGVFCRTEPPALLSKCIQCVHSGQIWANSRQLQMVVEAFAKASPFRSQELPFTRREQEVVQALCQGLSNRRIAERLYLSEHTVKNYLLRIFEKFGVSSRGELMFKLMSQNGGCTGQHPPQPEAPEVLEASLTLPLPLRQDLVTENLEREEREGSKVSVLEARIPEDSNPEASADAIVDSVGAA